VPTTRRTVNCRHDFVRGPDYAPLRVPVRACLRARESERGKTVTAHAFRFRKLRAKVSAKPRSIQSAKWSSQDIARFGQKITTARQR
jgi:hypothetical protein